VVQDIFSLHKAYQHKVVNDAGVSAKTETEAEVRFSNARSKVYALQSAFASDESLTPCGTDRSNLNELLKNMPLSIEFEANGEEKFVYLDEHEQEGKLSPGELALNALTKKIVIHAPNSSLHEKSTAQVHFISLSTLHLAPKSAAWQLFIKDSDGQTGIPIKIQAGGEEGYLTQTGELSTKISESVKLDQDAYLKAAKDQLTLVFFAFNQEVSGLSARQSSVIRLMLPSNSDIGALIFNKWNIHSLLQPLWLRALKEVLAETKFLKIKTVELVSLDETALQTAELDKTTPPVKAITEEAFLVADETMHCAVVIPSNISLHGLDARYAEAFAKTLHDQAWMMNPHILSPKNHIILKQEARCTAQAQVRLYPLHLPQWHQSDMYALLASDENGGGYAVSEVSSVYKGSKPGSVVSDESSTVSKARRMPVDRVVTSSNGSGSINGDLPPRPPVAAPRPPVAAPKPFTQPQQPVVTSTLIVPMMQQQQQQQQQQRQQERLETEPLLPSSAADSDKKNKKSGCCTIL